jgi:hypothetical protein
MGRIGGEVFSLWIWSIIIAENDGRTPPIIIAVPILLRDHRLKFQKLFDVKGCPIQEINSAMQV